MNRNLQLPSSLQYLLPALQRVSHLATTDAVTAFAQCINEDDFVLLVDAFRTIQERDQSVAVSEWVRGVSNGPAERRARWAISRMFAVFETLAAMGVSPFDSGSVRIHERVRPSLGWSSLPNDLTYLIPYFEKFGQCQSGDEIICLIEHMSDRERDDLAGVAERMRLGGHAKALHSWVRDHPLTLFVEPALAHYFLGVLDQLDLPFD